MPFGTCRNVYDVRHEWACHSMWPVEISSEEAKRYTIGAAEYGTTQPYSASVLNISAMSYGAISDNAIVALNTGARYGNFYHNTGEGGVSRFHLEGGGDIVWNIGTGYFGCGTPGHGSERIFDPSMFQSTIESGKDRIKMIEIKLSQGAKPGHGGLLPKAKVTQEIAAARRIEFPPTSDCHSPAGHSAFRNPHELVAFIVKLRSLSGGLPVGIKLCVGDLRDVAALCKAIVERGNGPDFITVDGAEGGTGAAPPELSNSVGLPLEEGLVVVRNMLVGAGLKDKIAINASGRVTTGFSIVRTIALGADITCAARAFMMSLGCIQALKCNTNKCPTGIATLNKDLMYGLDPVQKSVRGTLTVREMPSGSPLLHSSYHALLFAPAHLVFNYHNKTVQAASDIVGILGKHSFQELSGNDIMRRVTANEVRTLSEHFPTVEPGCLLSGMAPPRLQKIWDEVGNQEGRLVSTSNHWIY
jgi:glutamate synthase domain-containing protein 2